MKDATYWAEKIKNREVSPSELLKETARQIEQKNPLYHAVVESDLEQALKELETLTLDLDAPFTGVPFALKMLGQNKKGMGASAGSRLLADYRAESTDYFVSKIERTGFIPFAKTNVPEFGFKNISDASLYGVTRNVWNPKHHAGGSSGGAASAVASGMFPIAGASDGGGSIRIPASFSGLIGLKPTRGSMPVGPGSWRDWQGASINFALTLSMRDTMTLFEHMRGTSKAAPYQAPFSDYQLATQTRPLRIAYCVDSPVGTPVSQDAKNALKQAVDFLASQGHELEEIAYPVDGRALIESYYAMNGAETVAMFSPMTAALKRDLTEQDMEAMTWGLYQYGQHIPAGEYVQALQLWDEATATMEQLFESYDAFLSPTATDVAPRIDTDLQSDGIRAGLENARYLDKPALKKLVYEMFEKSLAITPYTQLANLTGQPAISLPTYVTSTGLPIGIQLMASKGREDILFRVGQLFENEQKFYLPSYYNV